MLEKLKIILSEVTPYEKGHHMGLPFLSAYQLAIEFEKSTLTKLMRFKTYRQRLPDYYRKP